MCSILCYFSTYQLMLILDQFLKTIIYNISISSLLLLSID